MRSEPKQEVKIVRFFNWTDKPFSWKWDNTPYTFGAGETVMMEDWKAEHFTKHLVDREMDKKGIPTDHFTRPEYEVKCLIQVDGTVARGAGEISKLETELLNVLPETRTAAEIEKVERKELQKENKPTFCAFCDSKGVRHKLACTKFLPDGSFKNPVVMPVV